MRTLLSRIAAVMAGLAVAAVLGFGAVQSQAAATALDHCALVPGPDIHCTSVNDCFPECDGAQMVACTEVQGENCCECRF